MELQFQKKGLTLFKEVVNEVQNQEQTQEIKLSDGLPDIGKVVGAWGQVILRSKEWRSDSILLSGGVMVWVLYNPEDGSEEKTIDSWIPFQMKWDLPPSLPEGKIIVDCRMRFVDARSVSPRKLMIRTGVTAKGKVLAPMEVMVYSPESVPGDVAILQRENPVTVLQEAGEKYFNIEEELNTSSGNGSPMRIIYYSVHADVQDKKVIGDKIAFRGAINLHVLYKTERDTLESQNFMCSFSQYAELKETYGSSADVSIIPSVTGLELDLTEDGNMNIKCGVAAQYMIRDEVVLNLVEDAYSPYRKIKVIEENMELISKTEHRKESLSGQAEFQTEIHNPVDISFMADYPQIQIIDDSAEITAPGSIQVLYYDKDGKLQSSSTRWEGRNTLKLAGSNMLDVTLLTIQEPQITTAGAHAYGKGEMPLELIGMASDGVRQITGMDMGEMEEPDPARPSLILRRAGENTLWEIAKESGSTIDLIRKANGLEGEATAGQMLLIPVS